MADTDLVKLSVLQAESARTNEANSVIAFLVGVLAEVTKSTTVSEAQTYAIMGLERIEEWHIGMWQPSTGDDPANWRPK